jgi:hypothetical protein
MVSTAATMTLCRSAPEPARYRLRHPAGLDRVENVGDSAGVGNDRAVSRHRNAVGRSVHGDFVARVLRAAERLMRHAVLIIALIPCVEFGAASAFIFAAVP